MSQTHIHHVVPRSRGGTNEPENLVELDFIEHARLHAEDFLQGGPRFDFRQAGWPYLDKDLRASVLQRAAEDTRQKNLSREVPTALGCKHSLESRRRRSEKLRGSNNPMFGRKPPSSRIRRAQKVANSNKFICLVTGKVTTQGPLVQWQRARDIHPHFRMSLSTLFFFIEKLCLK